MKLYTEQEKAQYSARRTVPVTAGRWKEGVLEMGLHKPNGDLLSRSVWIEQLAQCIRLSMTREEFLERVVPVFDRMEERIDAAVKATGRKRAYFLKENVVENPAADYALFVVTYGDWQLRRGLFHKEMVSVREVLGW